MIKEELGLTRWHNTDFHNRWNEYQHWNATKDLIAIGQIRDVFGPMECIGVGAGVRKADWEALKFEIGLTGEPIRFCLDFCIRTLIHRLHQRPQDEGIAIYIDKDENENLAKEITDWHVDYHRHNDEAADPQRPVSLNFGYDRQYIPIQVADILANETYRYMHFVLPPAEYSLCWRNGYRATGTKIGSDARGDIAQQICDGAVLLKRNTSPND